MKVSGLIFDLDGTLIDSMGLWTNSAVIYLEEKGIPHGSEVGEAVAAASFNGAIKYLKEHFDISDSTEKIGADLLGVLDARYFLCRLKPFVREFLEQMKADGVKMCVATVTKRSYAEGVLKANGVLELFEKVISCDDLGVEKESPLVYHTALKCLSTPIEETPVFEDNSFSAETAKKAGFTVIAVYDQYERFPERLRASSDHYINNFSELSLFIRP